MLETLPSGLWLARCARRIGEIDAQIAEPEAKRIARDLHKFERTRAMQPEVAVEFVCGELAKPDRVPFERRRDNR